MADPVSVLAVQAAEEVYAMLECLSREDRAEAEEHRSRAAFLLARMKEASCQSRPH